MSFKIYLKLVRDILTPANTEPMIDSIFDDEDASTSTNQNYMIDVPDILEMMDTQDHDPMINT